MISKGPVFLFGRFKLNVRIEYNAIAEDLNELVSHLVIWHFFKSMLSLQFLDQILVHLVQTQRTSCFENTVGDARQIRELFRHEVEPKHVFASFDIDLVLLEYDVIASIESLAPCNVYLLQIQTHSH